MKRKAIVKREGRLKGLTVMVGDIIENDEENLNGCYRCVIHGNDTNYAIHPDDLEFLEEE